MKMSRAQFNRFYFAIDKIFKGMMDWDPENLSQHSQNLWIKAAEDLEHALWLMEQIDLTRLKDR